MNDLYVLSSVVFMCFSHGYVFLVYIAIPITLMVMGIAIYLTHATLDSDVYFRLPHVTSSVRSEGVLHTIHAIKFCRHEERVPLPGQAAGRFRSVCPRRTIGIPFRLCRVAKGYAGSLASLRMVLMYARKVDF